MWRRQIRRCFAWGYMDVCTNVTGQGNVHNYSTYVHISVSLEGREINANRKGSPKNLSFVLQETLVEFIQSVLHRFMGPPLTGLTIRRWLWPDHPSTTAVQTGKKMMMISISWVLCGKIKCKSHGAIIIHTTHSISFAIENPFVVNIFATFYFLRLLFLLSKSEED